MASLDDTIRNIDKALQELNAQRERFAITVVQDGIGLAKTRVINKGERADGSQFSGYSQAVVPYWFFGQNLTNVGFNIEAKRKELLDKKGYFASYRDWREITNRVVDFKNFSFSNTMWASIVPRVVGKGAALVTVEIGSNVAFYDKTVIPAHNNREGINILQLNDRELGILQSAHESRVRRILKKNKLL